MITPNNLTKAPVTRTVANMVTSYEEGISASARRDNFMDDLLESLIVKGRCRFCKL